MKFLKYAAAAVAFSVALAGSQALGAEKTFKIGAAVYGLKGEFVQSWANALKEHPAIKNGMVKLTIFDGNYDALTQNNQFDTMITQKFDAILFIPIDIDAGASAVEKASEAKIPVIGSNTRVNSDKLTAYVGSDDVISGGMEADVVVDELKGKGNIVIFEGPIGQSSQIERGKGNMLTLAKHPDIKVLEMKTANWSRAEAMSLMENWLTAHQGKINGVIGQNDEMALGAIEALKSYGVDPKSIPIVGIDGVADAVQAVKRGEMRVSILQDARAQSHGALDVALRHLVGADYKPLSPVWEQYKDQMPWKDGMEKTYNVPWTPITSDNVDSFLPK